MPIEASVDFGSFGFSVKSVILPVSSQVMMPKREASERGTSMTAMVLSASLAMW